MPDLTANPDAPISVKSILFWRHIVGIVLLLLLQHGAENVPHFLGRWLGSIIIAFAGAGIIAGFGYLFFTSWLKNKVLRTFVICAWAIAALLLFGQWVLPDMVSRIAAPKTHTNVFDQFDKQPSENTNASRTPQPASDKPNAFDDYLRREAADAEVEKAHPGWKRIVATPEFLAWLPKQSERIKELAASDQPADAILLFDKFMADTEGRTGRSEVLTPKRKQ